MYEAVIDRIQSISDGIGRNEIDVSGIPLQELLSVAGESVKNAGIPSDELYLPILKLLNGVTNQRDPEGISAILELIALWLKMYDKLEECGKIALGYHDICFKRMPEYNYMKNNERLDAYYKTHERRKDLPFTGKGCVYTVLTGGYDELFPPEYRDDEWDYIVFTDNEALRADGWEVRVIRNEKNLDLRRWSRHPKILPYTYLSEYDYCIYIDANICIVGDVREYIKKYSTNESMLCVNHHVNADIYEEAELCIDYGKGDPIQIRDQVDRYRKEGFPENHGLTQNNFLIRSLKDDRLKKVMNDWWEEYMAGSERDQISLPYCIWKNEFMYDTSPICVMDNSYFVLREHRK